MEIWAALLVGRPLAILLVSAVFLAGFVVLQFTSLGAGRHARALLVVAGAWTLYAAWEWFVQVRTPEANIRVDLLVIWPVMLIVSVWFTIRALR